MKDNENRERVLCKKSVTLHDFSTMRKFFRIIKRIFQISVLTPGALYALLYIITSLPAVQDKLRERGETMLSETLCVPVDITRIEFSPFNRIELFGVTLPDRQGDTLLYANKIGVGVDVIRLITEERISLNNIQLFGLDVHITKETPSSPTNLQFIIDAFSPEGKRGARPIDLRINSALIRRSRLRYDVLSEPHTDLHRFDANHISVHELTANLALKAFDNDTIDAHIKRLSFKEQSGLHVERLTLRTQGNRHGAKLAQFSLQLPHTKLSTEQAVVEWGNITDIEQMLDSAHVELEIDHSRIVLSDLSPLLPSLRQFHSPIEVSCQIAGNADDIQIADITLDMGDGDVRFHTAATLKNILHRENLYIDCSPLRIETSAIGARSIGVNLGIEDDATMEMLTALSDVEFDGNINGHLSNINAVARLHSGIGDVQIESVLNADTSFSAIQCQAHVKTEGINLKPIVGATSKIGVVALNIDVNATTQKKKLYSTQVRGKIDKVEYNQYTYSDITINGLYEDNNYNGHITLNDPNGYIDIDGKLQLKEEQKSADIAICCNQADLAAFNLLPQSKGNILSFDGDISLTGDKIENLNGYIHIDDIVYGDSINNVVCDRLYIKTENDTFPQKITIESDYAEGYIQGTYNTANLVQSLQVMMQPVVPSLIPASVPKVSEISTENNFEWYMTFTPNVQMSQILELPFTLTDTACIDGYLYGTNQKARLHVSAPYIWIGKTHMEKMDIAINQHDGKMDCDIQTGIINHLKDITTTWHITGDAHNDQIDLGIGWESNTAATFNGNIVLNAQLSRNANNKEQVDIGVEIEPTDIIINDTVWNIKAADVSVKEKEIAVNGIEISRPLQHIYIDGKISENASDTLYVELQDINLDYVFETLNIDFVTFGGRATGRVDAANLFSPTPHIATKSLDIRDFSYNDAVFGDLSLMSNFDLNEMSILLKGIINNKRGQESIVDGYIYPTRDSLSIAFDVDHVPLKFIRPFVGTILSDVDGEASGEIVLEGHFERIYIYGDAYAYDFSFGVPFINTRYHLSDSVHFSQDAIMFNDITVYDEYGNTAKAHGELHHKYFTNLDYDIKIYDTDNIEVFNVPHTPGAMFYGNIYGSGDVSIKGNDYRTDIDVKMTTDRNSAFTYALTNTLSAIDYPFLSFTNKREPKEEPVISIISQRDSAVIRNNNIMLKAQKPQIPLNTLYLTLEANITPVADITLVMNEMTGDEMKVNGEGVLRMEYNTATNDIMMFGSVEINRGKYNFSIEDLIRRNFTINSGSSVTFQGNPMNAQLDIDATYSLQANLADLDKSFAQDSELTRTTVPVDTKLIIQGDLMKPEIGFDIELPTLSADMESKMRSIVSTDEMMRRQIIYLLALNTFFTPEFNSGGNTGSNNELSAMATSALSSSLGSLMGQFSENWNISPNLRSEQGDFTDIEVDLYLSSQLLNNRLIFNGNIGYRDSRYSSTNFIGDFDIEYLLNESGTLRLKGYNHFNDRNYTLRTALTTQGIGIVYKHDFNTWANFFEFSKRKKKKEKIEDNGEKGEKIDADELEQMSDSVLTTIPEILE